MAYQHLANVQSSATDALATLAAEPSSAYPLLAGLADDASAAYELTSDPIWSLAETVPWVGPQLATLRAIAQASDELLTGSMVPLLDAADGLSLDILKPTRGRIETSTLEAVVAPAQSAAESARLAAIRLDSVDRGPLLGVVNEALTRADDVFTSAATSLDAMARAAQVLPTMLGAQEERTYLILVQNNAEWRSLGGITGTAIIVTASNGEIRLVGSESATSLGRGATGPLPQLDPGVVSIFGSGPASYFHNLTQIPDFSIDGPLAQAAYERKTGVKVDGVVAVDPVVLSYLLQATGPVTLPTGRKLTSDNAVETLLSKVYAEYDDPVAQDSFFAMATGAVFNAFLEGQGSTPGLFRALTRAGNEHRLYVWSSHTEEQAVFDSTTIAGHLPTTDARAVRFGVYLNDASGSKMSYFVHPQVDLRWQSCDPDATGHKTIFLDLTLRSDAPADAASSLPPYVTGNGAHGTAPGNAHVIGHVILPEGFELVSAETSTGGTFADGQLQGRRVLTFEVNLAPQQSESASFAVTGLTDAASSEAFTTPTVDAKLDPVVRDQCEPALAASLR